MRKALLVLGMHRSGTSALTRILSILGAALPKHVIGAGPSNQAGHWEPERLVHLHDAMLAEAGSNWDDWRAFDPVLLGPDRLADYKSELKRLIVEEYGDAPLIVIKDPRICRFVSLYQDILPGIGFEPAYVLALRHPLSVAASLVARDGMTKSYGILLWLRHVLDSEKATCGKARAFVRYEQLLDDPAASLARLASAIAIQWPVSIQDAAPEIKAALRHDLQHHREVIADSDSLSQLALEVSAGLATAASNDADASLETPRVLRQAHDYLDRLEQTSSVLAGEFHRREQALKIEINRSRAQSDSLAGQLRECSVSLASQLNECEVQRALNQSITERLHESSVQLARTIEQLNDCSVQLVDRSRQLTECQDRIAALESHLGEIQRSKAWKAVLYLRRAKEMIGG